MWKNENCKPIILAKPHFPHPFIQWNKNMNISMFMYGIHRSASHQNFHPDAVIQPEVPFSSISLSFFFLFDDVEKDKCLTWPWKLLSYLYPKRKVSQKMYPLHRNNCFHMNENWETTISDRKKPAAFFIFPFSSIFFIIYFFCPEYMN